MAFSIRDKWYAWRISRLNARTRSSENKDIQTLRKIAYERSLTINELNDEIAELQRQNSLNVERYDDKIDRLERQIEMAQEENRLLAAIHDRDVERMVAEVVIMRAKSEQVAMMGGRVADVFGDGG